MSLRSTVLASSCVLVFLLLGVRAEAQGRFSNFETPQTHPIDIAHVGELDYVLVCNTPDNSVDIYKAAPPHAFVQRVPVGMGPATVRWNGALGRFYTCNFDGDSVSIVRLDAAGSSVSAVIERTDSLFVGDEPSDIAFDSTNTTAVISLSSRSSVTLVNALNLAPAGGEVRLTVAGPPPLTRAVKAPRRVAWLPDGRFFAANLRGGSPDPSQPLQYDIGIFRHDTASPTGPDEIIGGLGSTNHSFAINSTGTLMFVVGTKAQNHNPAAVGVNAVRQLKTGFVQSWLMVVDIPPGGAMNVHNEAPININNPAPLFQSINLNRNYGATTSTPLVEVPADSALVQPTDVLLIENIEGIAKIVLTAYHSDRVAILTPSSSTFGGYAIQRINIPVLTPTSKYTVSGPRGLAYSAQNQRIFTNGRLDNTLSVINSTTGVLTAQIQLPNDPTPNEIREGRQFLYSNRFSINDSSSTHTGGFVSCAVCHVDARTDGLPWDLGDTTLGPPIPPEFHDQDLPSTSPPMPNFPSEKGPLVTQTLQGLINYPLNESMQKASTNAPYHWRGDKFDFTDFNEAFVNLQGMDDAALTNGPKGISDDDMIKYRRFINTVLHPPNFEQDLFRTTTGTLGSDANDPAQATGAKLGMMIFHDFASDFVGSGLGRSCVDCHALPDGSSNTATETFSVNKTVSMSGAEQHLFETAALRNLGAREMLLHTDFTGISTVFTSNNGLLHPGNFQLLSSFSINTIVHDNFSIPGAGTPAEAVNRDALTEFVRKLDTGVAPMAGFAYTVDPNLSPVDSGLNAIAFGSLEGQVREANIGLGVYTRNNGTVKGYWYDITQPSPMYREEGTSNLIARSALLALALPLGSDNVVIAQGTPLGADRRWSNPNGQATLITGLRATNVRLENMAPNTAFVDIPKFNLALHTSPLAPTDSSIWTLRVLQMSVVGSSFGVPAVRHEPPRRFRVTGDNIRVGAKLRLSMAAGPNPASSPLDSMDNMELHPTQYAVDGRQVWETLVELDATQTFALLNGGYHAPDVDNVLKRLTTTPNLQPGAWNKFLVAVRNEDTSAFPIPTNWKPLIIQDNR